MSTLYIGNFWQMRRITPLLWIVAVFFVDQVSKAVVLKAFSPGESKEVFGDFLRISLVLNRGGIFGLGQSLGGVFLVLSVGVLLFALYLSKELRQNKVLGFVIGGAIGNLLDRVRYGAVVDFIDIGYKGLRWPVFNLADLAITLGMILMLLNWVKEK